MRDMATLLKQVPYFAELADERLRLLAQEVRVRRYRDGEPILAEGERCGGLGIVLAGHVKIFKLSDQGREQILRLLGPGRTFNDVPVFDGGANPGNVAALEPSEVGMLAKARMLGLIEDEPAVARAVIRVLATRLRAMTMMVEDLALRGVAARVARILLDCSRGQPALSETGANACLHLTHERIAAMAGSVREVVQRALKTLQREGAIELGRGRIRIVEPSILALWSGAGKAEAA